MEPPEEVLRVRAPRLGEKKLAAELREELGELVGVARFVEEIGAEDEVPWGAAEQGGGLSPAGARNSERSAVAFGVDAQQLDRVLRPVRRESVGPAQRRRERRKAEPAAELDHLAAREVEPRNVARKRESARPELRPVREELLLVERGLVNQRLGIRRAQEGQP